MSWLHREEDILAALKELENNNEEWNDDYDFLAISFRGILQAKDLATLLTKMHGLEKIVITDVALEGDLTRVGKALASMPQLVAIELNCDFKGEEALSTIPCLGTALGSLEELQSVRIHHSMTFLLTSLVSDGPNAMDKSELTVMFDDRVPDKDIAHCMSILEKSSTLKTLKLAGLYGPHAMASAQSILSLGQLVLCNKSIVNLEATVAPGVSLLPVAESLKENTSLEHLNLNPSWSPELQMDREEVNRFYDVLKYHNFTLRSINVLPSVWGFQDKTIERKLRMMNFLCAMNGYHGKKSRVAVRKQIVDDSNATVDDLMEFLENENSSKSEDDTTTIGVSSLFFHLQLNPNLWSHPICSQAS